MAPDLHKPRHIVKRVLALSALVVLFLLIAGLARGYFAFRDRVPAYSLDLHVSSTNAAILSKPLRVGFSRLKINPDLSNKDRPIYVAGFGQNRRATGIHDDLWAIASVLDDGVSRVAFVSLDAIGFFHDDVARVRRQLARDWNLTYVAIFSTHNHSTPDVMGLWGPDYLHTGVNQRYLESVRAACANVVGMAVSNLQPARVAFHEIPTDPAGLEADSRKPIVFDPNIRLIRFVATDSTNTLGSIIAWADHPETPWSANTELTADFCGYLRDTIENGVTVEGKRIVSGHGGIHLYVNGAIGGLMTTSPSVTVRDPFLERDFKEPSHDKARALGRQLASRIEPFFEEPVDGFTNRLPIGIDARTIELPLYNKVFLLAGYLGLLDRGYVRWRTLRSEVALLTLGETSIACIPGEIYPEIVNGGIERAPGGDFPVEPIEVPPIRDLMPGKVKFVFGLANDEVGYLIPKSEWDEKPPYLYGQSHAPYGEINSVGPDAAGVVHAAIKQLCAEQAKEVH